MDNDWERLVVSSVVQVYALIVAAMFGGFSVLVNIVVFACRWTDPSEDPKVLQIASLILQFIGLVSIGVAGYCLRKMLFLAVKFSPNASDRDDSPTESLVELE